MEVKDEHEVVSRGDHERFIVDMDKFVAKLLVESFRIPTPGYIRVLRGEECNIEDIRTKLGGKLVVKPSTEGSALGVSTRRQWRRSRLCD